MVAGSCGHGGEPSDSCTVELVTLFIINVNYCVCIINTVVIL